MFSQHGPLIVCAAFLLSALPCSAQDAPTPAALTPAHRLGVKMRLSDGRNLYQPTRKQIGVSYATGNDAAPAGQFTFTVDRRALRTYLNKIAPAIHRAPHDAKVVVTEPNATDQGDAQVPAKIVPGYDGAVLDTDAAVDAVQKSVITQPAVTHILLPLKIRAAKATTGKLQGIDARVGYFVTRFNPGDVGRTDTVRRAISIIDGTVVPPGGIFSVDKTVGPRDPAHGFNGKGHVFINGHMELQSGGGMCQVATTLFAASMLADLKIVERHQHVRTIPYAEPGRDATIYHGSKDFRIQNDTDTPLYISYRTTRSHAIVAIFGKAVPGRKVRLAGTSKRLGPRHYTGTFYRVVVEPDGTKHRDPTFYSVYKWTPALDYSR